jgi:Ca-activated chloride channel homolog
MLTVIPHRSRPRAGVAGLAMLTLLAALPSSASAQRSGAQPGAGVSVVFTALGKDGKAVGDIGVDDVKVSADGAPVQPNGLKRREDGPVFFTVAIDTGASEERMLPTSRMVAGLFIKSLMRPGQDKTSVVTFSNDVTVEQEMTGDVSKALEAVGRVRFVPPQGYIGGGIMVGNPPPPGMPQGAGTTGMWDAVAQVGDKAMPRSLGAGRRVLLLITDGVDTSSSVKSNKAVAAALESGVVAYAIGIGDNYFDGVDKNSLRKLAERTGGRAFFPRKVGELADIFSRIQEELLSQYVVTFDAPGDARAGQLHKVKVELTNPALRARGVRLDYPEGFFVGAPTTAKP